MWTLDRQMIKRFVESRLQAQMVEMAVGDVGILPGLLVRAVEGRKFLSIDDCRFVVISDASS